MSVVFLGAALVLGAPAAADAASRFVDDTGGINGPGGCLVQSAPCLTVQYAVDQAIAGDTVDLAAGTYSPGAVIDKANLTIRGAGTANTTWPDGRPCRATFDLRGSADGITIQDLRISARTPAAGTITDRTGVHVDQHRGPRRRRPHAERCRREGFKYAIDVRYPGSATGWTLDSVDARINEYGARFVGRDERHERERQPLRLQQLRPLRRAHGHDPEDPGGLRRTSR